MQWHSPVGVIKIWVTSPSLDCWELAILLWELSQVGKSVLRLRQVNLMPLTSYMCSCASGLTYLSFGFFIHKLMIIIGSSSLVVLMYVKQSTQLSLLFSRSCLTVRNPVDCSLPVPLSMEFFRQEYWSGLPFPSSGEIPHPGIKPASPALQVDSL